jgi:hypothetical protein
MCRRQWERFNIDHRTKETGKRKKAGLEKGERQRGKFLASTLAKGLFICPFFIF